MLIGRIAFLPNISSEGVCKLDSCLAVLYANTHVSKNVSHSSFRALVNFTSIYLRVWFHLSSKLLASEHTIMLFLVQNIHVRSCYFFNPFRYDPLVKYWTMHFEVKHNHLKKFAQHIGNFINISWTLACQHQYWQCYKWMDEW